MIDTRAIWLLQQQLTIAQMDYNTLVGNLAEAEHSVESATKQFIDGHITANELLRIVLFLAQIVNDVAAAEATMHNLEEQLRIGAVTT